MHGLLNHILQSLALNLVPPQVTYNIILSVTSIHNIYTLMFGNMFLYFSSSKYCVDLIGYLRTYIFIEILQLGILFLNYHNEH